MFAEDLKGQDEAVGFMLRCGFALFPPPCSHGHALFDLESEASSSAAEAACLAHRLPVTLLLPSAR